MNSIIKTNFYGIVTSISFFSKKSTFLGLVKFSNGSLIYVTLQAGLSVGSMVYSNYSKAIKFFKLQIGITAYILFFTPLTLICNLAIFPKKKFTYAKSAGTFCQIIEIDDERNQVLLEYPTKIKKWVHGYSIATTGRNANLLKFYESYGKAGYYRLVGSRPVVRGVAMNPVDHPHGGRTKTSSPERTPWGRVAKHNR